MNFATNYLRHCWMQTTTTPQRGAENGIISAGWSVREGEPKLDRILLLNHNENDKLRSSKVGGSRTEARQDENEGDIIMSNTVTNNLWPLPNIVAFAEAIRLVRVEAPNLVEVGKPIKLRCIYELRGEKLQSLAWYKNGREFYRYQPFERRQPVLTFGLAGVNVDMSRSRNSTVHLTNTTLETTGRYKCEATSTTFREAHQEVSVQVIEAESSGRVSLAINSIILTLPYLTAVLLTSFAHHNNQGRIP